VQLSEVLRINRPTEALHEAAVQPVVVLVLRLVDEVEIPTYEPSSRAGSGQGLKLREERFLERVIRSARRR